MKTKILSTTTLITVFLIANLSSFAQWTDEGTYMKTYDDLTIKKDQESNWNSHREMELSGSILIHRTNSNEPPSSMLFAQDLPYDHDGWGEYGIEYKIGSSSDHSEGGLNFWKPWGNSYDGTTHNSILFLHNNRNVGIGTNDPSSKLTVNGWIKAEGIKIIQNVVGADFVFEKDYDLMSLDQLESYIDTNKHLPGIPSAEEMKEQGVNLNEFQGKLLQKIEELTLYMIKLEKKNQELEKHIKALKE